MSRSVRLAFAVAALAAASPSLGEEDLVWAHQLDEALEVSRSTHWAAGGAFSGPLHVRPDGEIVALVAKAGRTDLVRWRPDGRETFRRPVKIRGPVKTSRLRRDGDLIVVTDSALLRMSTADGKVLVRTLLGFDARGVEAEAAPNGAWFAYADLLRYVRLDGSRVEKTLPLAVPEGPDNGFVAMLATERDECLLKENRVTSHDVRGRRFKPDKTNELILTLVDSRGNVVAQKRQGGVWTRWEWFWHEEAGDAPLPTAFGLVRTRYEGGVGLHGWAERGDGDFLLVLHVDRGRHRLVRMDHALRERWARPFSDATEATVSPPWAAGLLVCDGHGSLSSFDERGGSERSTSLTYPAPPYPSHMTRVAIGRDSEARWIHVEYGRESGGH